MNACKNLLEMESVNYLNDVNNYHIQKELSASDIMLPRIIERRNERTRNFFLEDFGTTFPRLILFLHPQHPFPCEHM